MSQPQPVNMFNDNSTSKNGPTYNVAQVKGDMNITHSVDEEPDQSMDETWRFRIKPHVAVRLKGLVDRSYKTNRSAFLRDCLELGEIFHEYKDVLIANADIFAALSRRIAKKK